MNGLYPDARVEHGLPPTSNDLEEIPLNNLNAGALECEERHKLRQLFDRVSVTSHGQT